VLLIKEMFLLQSNDVHECATQAQFRVPSPSCLPSPVPAKSMIPAPYVLDM